MNSPDAYVRARSAEQKEERRRHLLATAREMLRQNPAALDLGINELARQAQMTKSNVYRYFESSEAVLMDLLLEEYALWHAELGKALARGGRSGAGFEPVARAFAATISARPLLCRLTSILPSILERKVSFERMVDFKGQLLAVRDATARDFHARVPGMPLRAFERVVKHAFPLMIGLWPLGNPTGMAAQVAELPELESLRYDFERDLEQALLSLMRGAASS